MLMTSGTRFHTYGPPSGSWAREAVQIAKKASIR
jgi:hypothetical protein